MFALTSLPYQVAVLPFMSRTPDNTLPLVTQPERTSHCCQETMGYPLSATRPVAQSTSDLQHVSVWQSIYSHPTTGVQQLLGHTLKGFSQPTTLKAVMSSRATSRSVTKASKCHVPCIIWALRPSTLLMAASQPQHLPRHTLHSSSTHPTSYIVMLRAWRYNGHLMWCPP